MIAALLLSLIACDEVTSGATTGPTFSSVYGACPQGGRMIAVSEIDLGEPVAMFIEFETANGWVPYGLGDNVNAALVSRKEDSGLWLSCPDGSFQWHVSWAR